jgi:hypothetical protein
LTYDPEEMNASHCPVSNSRCQEECELELQWLARILNGARSYSE